MKSFTFYFHDGSRETVHATDCWKALSLLTARVGAVKAESCAFFYET